MSTTEENLHVTASKADGAVPHGAGEAGAPAPEAVAPAAKPSAPAVKKAAAPAAKTAEPGPAARPTSTAASFDDLGLSPAVLAAVRDLGYTAPTPVQERAIPEVLAGRDLLAAAQTGTGKTAAFLLPALNNLGHVAVAPKSGGKSPAARARARREAQGRGPLMLIITPTRELAQQIDDVAAKISRRTHHTAVTVVGGVSYNPQKSALKRGCDVLVATPGRLVDLIDQGAANLGEVRVLVLDEADRMLDMGFLPAVRKIVGQTPEERQTLLFSATLDEKAVGAITDLVSDPARVEIAPATSTAETVDQYVLPVSLEAKNALLAEVLKREGAERVIVFTRTKHRADACCRRLNRAGIKALPIHGNRSQGQRERALSDFRRGACDVLVATDVLARGIDISDVRYVVNFDVPEEPTDYIHRIGRTGRAGELGWALTFVTENDVDEFFAIEALMGKTAELFDATGLELGEKPPVVDPARVPAQKPGKKKTKRGKSTSKRGGRASGGAAARNGRGAGDGAGSRRRSGAQAAHSAARDGSARGAAAGERSPRPARPKHAGKARVHASDATEAVAFGRAVRAEYEPAPVKGSSDHADWSRYDRRHAQAASEDGVRAGKEDQASGSRRKASSTSRGGGRDAARGGRSARGERSGRGDAADGKSSSRARRSQRSGGENRNPSLSPAAHDWRNADQVSERRSRGARSGRAGGRDNRAGYGHGGKSQGIPYGGATGRRPGDRGGKR